MAVGTYLLTSEQLIPYGVKETQLNLSGLAYLPLSALIILLLILDYLNKTGTRNTNSNRTISGLRQKIINLEEAHKRTLSKLTEIQSSNIRFNENKTEEVVHQFQQHIESKVSDSYLESLKEEILQRYIDEQPTLEQRAIFERIMIRLELEMETLRKRANLNLSLGLITALSGILLLGVLAYSNPINVLPQEQKLSHFAAAYFPKLSVAVFVELLALFFLKSYRTTLSEIRYFQNEATTIELRSICVSSLDSDTPEFKQQLLLRLINDDRNKTATQDDLPIEDTKKILQDITSLVQKSKK